MKKDSIGSTSTATVIAVSCIFALGITTNAVAHEDKNWKTFINPEYKFSVYYPSDLEAHDFLSSCKGPELDFYSFEPGST